jgi:hypothetical protein
VARYCRIVCLDRGRHLRHAQLNGEANNTRLRGVGSGRRDPGAGSGVVSGTGAAADQPVLRRAVYGAGPRGVLCRGAPARLRRAVAGPDRAVVREGGKPDDPQLYCRRAGGGVRSIGRPRAQSPPDATTPGGRSRGVTATASPRLSTALRINPEQDLWKGHAGSAERLIAARGGFGRRRPHELRSAGADRDRDQQVADRREGTRPAGSRGRRRDPPRDHLDFAFDSKPDYLLVAVVAVQRHAVLGSEAGESGREEGAIGIILPHPAGCVIAPLKDRRSLDLLIMAALAMVASVPLPRALACIDLSFVA